MWLCSYYYYWFRNDYTLFWGTYVICTSVLLKVTAAVITVHSKLVGTSIVNLDNKCYGSGQKQKRNALMMPCEILRDEFRLNLLFSSI